MSAAFGAGQHGRRLHAGAGGDLLLDPGHDHGPAGQVSEHLAVGRRPGAAARPRSAGRRTGGKRRQRLEPVEEPADDALDGGAGEVAPVTSVRRPANVPVASGRFGVRSPSRYGSSVNPPAPAGAPSASSSNSAWSTPSSRAHGIGDLGGVQRAHQRQEPPGGVGEPGDGAGRVRRRAVAHRVDGAGGAERHGDVARSQPDAERSGHVVAGARRDDGTAPLAGGRSWSEHVRHHTAPSPGRRPRDRGVRTGRRPRRATSSQCPRRRRGRSSAGPSAEPSASRAAGRRGPGDPTTAVRDGAARTAW